MQVLCISPRMRPILFHRRQPEPLPAPGAQKHLERPSAQDIFEQVANNARHPQWSSHSRSLAGNICGGVGMVTLLEYGQVIVGRDAEAEALIPALAAAAKEEAKQEEIKA
jgi:hypothetical protein